VARRLSSRSRMSGGRPRRGAAMSATIRERLMPPIAYRYYKDMTPEGLDALVTYLRTLAPK
jgi:hypothetical protein